MVPNGGMWDILEVNINVIKSIGGCFGGFYKLTVLIIANQNKTSNRILSGCYLMKLKPQIESSILQNNAKHKNVTKDNN